MSSADYLELDDALMWASFAAWEKGPDAILADLAHRLRARVLPKIVPLPPGDDDETVRCHQEAVDRTRDIAKAHGLRPDLHVWLDVTSHTPYAEPEDDSPEGVWVAIRHHDMARLGDVSFVLGELRNKLIEAPRLVFPAEIREEVRDAIEGLLP